MLFMIDGLKIVLRFDVTTLEIYYIIQHYISELVTSKRKTIIYFYIYTLIIQKQIRTIFKF